MDINTGLLPCELSYMRQFCHIVTGPQLWHFSDPQITDMYDHNFTYIRARLPQQQLIAEASRGCRAADKYYKLVFSEQYTADEINGLIPLLPQPFSAERYGRYLLTQSDISGWTQRDNCEISILSSEDDVQQLIDMTVEENWQSAGGDFCRRSAARKGYVYLRGPIREYLLRHDGKLIGGCALLIADDCAKVEDFALLEQWQRQGFGTTLLKRVVADALRPGVGSVFLDADEDDTAKEMYLKLGFIKVGENSSLLWTRPAE